MKVLVCGGRHYSNRRVLFDTLDDINEGEKITVIIHGAAQGADALAAEWASNPLHRCSVFPFPAQWDTDGMRAGPLRNQRMLDDGKPDLVVAFPGGKGTADMVRRAKTAGVKVMKV